MSTQQPPHTHAQHSHFNTDRYVVMHVATTCDEHGVYVTKDSAEVIELGWILLDAANLEEVGFSPPVLILVLVLFFFRCLRAVAKSLLTTNLIKPQMHRESVLVKPVNTPITPLCSKSKTHPSPFPCFPLPTNRMGERHTCKKYRERSRCLRQHANEMKNLGRNRKKNSRGKNKERDKAEADGDF
jgi:hypothetical protein